MVQACRSISGNVESMQHGAYGVGYWDLLCLDLDLDFIL